MRRLLALFVGSVLLAAPASILAQEVDPSAVDLTNSPDARWVHDQLSSMLRGRPLRAAPGALRSAPSNGMTVTDYGRISVIRDANHSTWGDGLSLNSIRSGLDGSVKAYYQAHPDADPDFVMVVQDWFNASFAGAFYNPVANDTSGLGYTNVAGSDIFDDDPSTKMMGYIWMNGVQFFTTLPNHDLYTHILFGQELAHRWGTFIRFNDGGNPSDALLGRQLAHWSWYVDSGWSWMEGNGWHDNADGTWTTDVSTFPNVTHYNPVDLYLMGLIGPSDVPPFTLLTNPSLTGKRESAPDAWSASTDTISATPKTVSLQDIVAIEGPRVPDYTTSQKHFQIAVLYVLRRDDRIDATKVATMEGVLDRMTDAWNADVGNRAQVDFGPFGTPNHAPVVSLAAPSDGDQHHPVIFDAGQSVDPEGKALRFFWRFDPKGAFAEAGPKVEHVFGDVGDKTVEVDVRDEDGGETIVTRTLHIHRSGMYSCDVAPWTGARTGAPVAAAALLGSLLLARVALRRG